MAFFIIGTELRVLSYCMIYLGELIPGYCPNGLVAVWLPTFWPNSRAKTRKSGKLTVPSSLRSMRALKPLSVDFLPKALAKAKKSGKSTVPLPLKSDLARGSVG